MARTSFDTIDQYIAAQPKASQEILRKIRAAIRSALPKSEETIAYQMPTFEIDGATILHIAAWKAHESFYPASPALIAAFREELEPYELNDKGTLRFPLSKPVPVKLIGRLAKLRAKEVAERRAQGKPRPANATKAKPRASGAKVKRKSSTAAERKGAKPRRPAAKPRRAVRTSRT